MTVEIEPGASYRVGVRARSTPPLDGSKITVTERSSDEPLRVFELERLRFPWRGLETWLHASPEADRLEIAVASVHRRSEAGIDDLVVERVALTEQQRLSLLKARDNHPHSDAEGFAKRGRLLPLPEPEQFDAPRAANYRIRDAIYAPAPSEFEFPIVPPPGARLSLAYALSKESRPGDRARVRVLVDEEGRSQRVLLDDEVVLGPAEEDWTWQEWEGSLDDFAGRKVLLTLESRSLESEGTAHVLWGNPEVYTPRRKEEPNLILIAVDTLRADRLSCYGHTPGTSPNIDSLASDGVRFDQAIASANWTRPSFTALFTGRRVQGLLTEPRGLRESTLAERLRDAGYSTHGVVYKAPLYDRGYERGFDVFLNSPRFAIRAEENAATALEWLDRYSDRRFFLFLHFNDPHQPFCQPAEHLPEDVATRLEDYGLGMPVQITDREAMLARPMSEPVWDGKSVRCRGCKRGGVYTSEFKELAGDLYDDAVRYVDRQVGRFLDGLKAKGLYDESIIAFVSDHGEALWNHHDQFAHAETNLHDELIRVPLIVKGPAGDDWAVGREVTTQVRLIDLLPTLLDMAELDPTIPYSEAESLVPAMRKVEEELPERPAFSGGQWLESLSVRYRGFKYIRYAPDPDVAGSVVREELYDLKADPGELVDVAADHPDLVARMRAEVTGLPAPLSLQPSDGDAPAPIDARQLRALEALGYVD